jgi:hypothetical protein
MTSTIVAKDFLVKMPSQDILLNVSVDYGVLNIIDLIICYTHPTTGEYREAHRRPSKLSFSKKHFEKELDAYIVQEAMSDLTDNRHTLDWVD